MIWHKRALSAFVGLGLCATSALAADMTASETYDGVNAEAYAQRILRVEECFPSLDPSWMEAILREEMRDGMRDCAEMDLEFKRRREAADEDVVILRSFEDLIRDLRGEQTGL